jgi:hypothetical protein
MKIIIHRVSNIYEFSMKIIIHLLYRHQYSSFAQERCLIQQLPYKN